MTTSRAAPPFWELADDRGPSAGGGARFRLFAVLDDGLPPDLVTLSPRPGGIGPGPSDDQMYVADAADKRAPYDPPDYTPPYRGRLLPPALPDARGDFDHIPLGTPQFLAAHMYGCVRRTLDIWEGYLGRRVVWASADQYPRMELVPVVHWNNAQSGPGFIEAGLWRLQDGNTQPFALDFDVVAHETGHQILFSVVGVPAAAELDAPFLAFHEAFSDLVAMIALLRFPSVIPRLLEETQGNLYVLNLVNRFAETSATTQLRVLSNTVTMEEVGAIRLGPDGSWFDPAGLGRNQHAIAAPLEGAIFDVFVELYQETLVAEGLLPEEADARGWTRAEVGAAFDTLHLRTARAYRRFADGFATAVRHARDQVALAMAHAMLTIHPAGLTFGSVAARFLEGLLEHGNAAILEAAFDCFLARGIDPRPFMLFVPALAGRGRRAPGLLRVRAHPHRQDCVHCDRRGTRIAMILIRRGHAATRNPLAAA